MTDVTQEKKKGSTPGAPTVIIERIRDRFTHDSSGHYRVTTRGDGQTNTELINARVEITAAYSDDIGEPYPISVTEASDRAQPEITHYDLTVSRRGETPVELRDVSEEDFTKVTWTKRTALQGLQVATIGGQTARHDIMTAIKISSPHPIISAYARLGWHLRDEKWFYVHGGGAWAASGALEDVRLHGDGLGTFAMATPPADDESGRRAFCALWDMFEMGPDRFAAVEIGAAFRASMGRPTGSITYRAINQSGKSAHMAFIMQCWAPSVRWNRLPFNAGKVFATPTYIEHVHHTFGDMIVGWDDMAPVGTARERADYFDLFARSLFNGASKGRMGIQDKKIVARARMRPRAFGALSAEDLTAVESGQNRTHLVLLSREEFNERAYAAADGGTGPEDRSALMSAFIVWWAAKMPAYSEVAEKEAHFRSEFAKATGAPGRYIESVADKAAGLYYGLAFALERGWVTEDRLRELWQRGWVALCESLNAQVDAIAGNSIPDRIRDAIFDGLASRECHVLGLDGGQPQDSARLGWDGSYSRGRMIGWEQTNQLFLLPSAAGAFISEYAARTGAPIEITARAMGEALETAGYITGSDRPYKGRSVHRHTIAKKVLGQTKEVWLLRLPAEDGEEQLPEAGPQSPPAPAPAAAPVMCGGYDGPERCKLQLDPDGGDTVMHANCTEAPTLAPAPDSAGTPAKVEAAPAVPGPRAEAGPSGEKSGPVVDWAVLDADGTLILPDGTRRSLPDGWPAGVRHVGDLAAILRPQGIRALYVPATVAAEFGLPEEIGALAWNEGEAHPFAQAAVDDGWDVAPEGLAHWMTVYRTGEKGNGGTLVFPAWDADVDAWRTAGAEHVARTLAHVHAAVGVHYFRSPQTTMGRMVAAVERTHYRTANLTRIEVPEIRYELPGIYAPAVAAGIALEGMYLHSYDVNKQYASACRGTDLATAPYEHLASPEVPKYPLPGFWRLRADVTELRPCSGLRPVIDPARIKGRTWEGWVPTPTMTLLRDAGRKFEVLEAWVSPEKRRFLDEPMGMVTAGVANLRELSQEKGDPEDTASVILKTAYASWVNGTLRSTFGGSRREDDPWYRPDVTAMVQAQADARKARLLIKATESAPVHVIADETDCIVVLSADPNWETAVPGLALDESANGKFKHAGSAPVTEDIAKILRNTKRAKSGRCLDIKEAIKAHQGGK
ncbi:hypothetical protein OG590_40530 (plasmid) [Streptomyces goshikiensis]|uniref:hypothetical protein n=1 Tax=Streptomyces goshikiensis TaxID=1942 RepID=UPI002F90DC3F|nr:hypothetical protein OG590_40530 [Streptomyces goshikiensis]